MINLRSALSEPENRMKEFAIPSCETHNLKFMVLWGGYWGMPVQFGMVFTR